MVTDAQKKVNNSRFKIVLVLLYTEEAAYEKIKFYKSKFSLMAFFVAVIKYVLSDDLCTNSRLQ
jgi:hypothetical protein